IKKLSLFEITDDQLESLNGFGSYQGLGYTCREHSDFHLISKCINDYVVNANNKITQVDSVKLIQIMNSDPKQFILFFEWSDKQKHYKNKPILQFIKPDEFLNAFLNLPNETKRQFIPIIKDRLNQVLGKDDELYPEFEWFKLFKEQLEGHLKTASKSISTIILEFVIKQVSENIYFIERRLTHDTLS
ncbi:MAG: hypothetical protein J6N68_11430, partial [Shewanella sp.]|nr:hypothetical protein [Shewanella sp.]